MRSFDELADKARDPKALTFERKSAIDELAKHGDARVVGVLEELLGDGEGAIRREAINALGKVRGAEATRLLVRALDDGDRLCVKAALVQLGNRNDPAAAPALERLAEAGDFAVRIEAKRLLSQLQVRPAENRAPELRPHRDRRPQAPERPPEPPPPKASVVPTAAPVTRKPVVPPPPPPPTPPVQPRGDGEQLAPEVLLPPLRELKRSFSRARNAPSRRPWERDEPHGRSKTDPDRVRARLIGLALFFIFVFILLMGRCVGR